MSKQMTGPWKSAKHMPPAKVCRSCGAIVGRGHESYPDNHWEWCSASGGEPLDGDRDEH